MSERRPPPRGPAAEETPEARVHPIEWSPWIWLLPALAILAVGWFVVRYAVFGGGEVTVRFVEARGLDRYSPVRYRGAKVGTVQEINIDEDLAQVVVRISMDAGMRDALREGTSFWIVEPDLSGGLGSLLTGTYIGIAPGPGEPTRVFQGREHPPILAAPEPGKIFLLEASGLGTATIGSPVEFRGMRVGRVLGGEYDHRRGVTTMNVFVLEPFAVYVRETTRFWRAGGFELGLEGGKLSLGDLSLGSLLTSAFSFYTPEVLAGELVPEGTRFELFETEAAAVADSGGPNLPYRVSFPGPVGGLAAGTPVTLRGVQVGRVREVRLRYVPETGTLETPVILVVDPRKLEIPVPAGTTRAELRATLDAAMARLVDGGLRATLQTSLILPGASAVSLERVGAPGTARLDLASDPPEIPAAGGGDGLAGALAAIERVAATIEDLPLREIAGDLRSAALRVDALVHDPRLDRSLGRLDAAMADVEAAAETA
ncbi:MAG TPA: MlaD family protein, partial [Thermoanaerobaculia bacterium]|nr:MlaD family protein [Thermoanaerobaculia bacterium]